MVVVDSNKEILVARGDSKAVVRHLAPNAVYIFRIFPDISYGVYGQVSDLWLTTLAASALSAVG